MMGLFRIPLVPILVVIFVLIILPCIVIVPENTEVVVEQLGKYCRTLRAGVNIKVPFIQRIVNRVSLKEHVHDFQPQAVITKDNVSMLIDSVVYCRVVDSYKFTYMIANPVDAIGKITATTLRNIVGTMTLDELLTARDKINAELLEEVDKATDVWGIDITRIEVQNITPPPEIKEAMDKQMIAERNKRATILEAQATKEKAITEAEGKKDAMLREAEAKKDAMLMEAEAKAKSIELVANAEAEAIRKINEQKPSDAYIKLEAIKSLKFVADGQATKLVIPSDIASVTSNVLAIKEMITDKK